MRLPQGSGLPGYIKDTVSLVMVWEFPAVSQTRIDFWKQPQFTQSGMWWFTLLFGIVGGHHLLMRSPQTALIFLIANFLTFGYLWFYDLIQLSSYGGNTTESLNKYGLSHPWGPLGLAQGMWLPPKGENAEQTGGGCDTTPGKPNTEPPSPYIFFLYALLLPASPIAQLVAGDGMNALARAIEFTILPTGWIWYAVSLLYDYWILLAQPADLFMFGSKRCLKALTFFMDYDGHSPSLMYVPGGSAAASAGKGNSWISMLLAPIFSVFKPAVNLAKGVIEVLPIEPAVEVARDTVKAAYTTASTGLDIASKVASAAQKIGIDSALSKAKTAVDISQKVGTLAATIPGATAGPLAKAAALAANPAVYTQSGGGSLTSLEYFTAGTVGAVVVGGLLLGATRSIQRNGEVYDDAPPNARTI